MATPTRMRRTCLTVPATSAGKLEKAATLAVDEVVIDLEDSVPPAARTNATRQQVVDAMAQLDWRAATLAVRVNPVGTAWFDEDVEVVARAVSRLDCLVVPKVESADDVSATVSLLERSGSAAGVEVQIESARGLVAVEEIAAASQRLEALVFGPGDFAASLGVLEPQLGGIEERYPGDQWHYARSRIAVAAHAFGLAPVDGPFAGLDDLPQLRESAMRARLLGFVGKWVIHPNQIEVCNDVFSPTAQELRRAHAIVDALTAAEQAGAGVATLEGEMIDEATARMARATIARGSLER